MGKLKECKSYSKAWGGSIMVWRCVTASGVRRFQIIDENADKFKYLKDLKEINLKERGKNIGH